MALLKILLYSNTMTDYFKNFIRLMLREIRSRLSTSFQQKASQQVCNRIKQLEPYRYAKRIALYHAVEGEITLDNLWRSAPLQGKFCYFPALTSDKTLVFLPATPATSFRKNRYNIPEPDVDFSFAIGINEIDILFLPLVAFDKHGTRLGMGAGYYDRTLTEQKSNLLLGVAYDFQRESFIQPHEWDIRLHAVVTPSQIYWST